MKTSTTRDSKKNRRIWLSCAAVLLWLILWQAAAWAVNLPLLLPSPAAVLRRLWELGATLLFWQTVGLSLVRILAGFLGGLLLGSLFAVLAWYSDFAQAMIRPLVGVLKTTPVASFIILALVWIRTEYLATVISMIMVLPLVYHNIKEGLDSADVQLLEMAKVFSLSPVKTIRACYLPAVRPFFLSAVTSGLGFAWKAGIAAEVLGRPAIAVGKQIYDAKVYLETTDLFAWTLVVILSSFLLEKSVLILADKIGKRQVRKIR